MTSSPPIMIIKSRLSEKGGRESSFKFPLGDNDVREELKVGRSIIILLLLITGLVLAGARETGQENTGESIRNVIF